MHLSRPASSRVLLSFVLLFLFIAISAMSQSGQPRPGATPPRTKEVKATKENWSAAVDANA